MNRNAFFLQLLILLILSITLSFSSGCVTTREIQGAEWEPWAGELTGGVGADLKMFFSRIEEGNDVYLVKGSFEGDIGEISGGYGGGTMNAKIEGKVKDGIFSIRLWGHANVSEGQANITGTGCGSRHASSKRRIRRTPGSSWRTTTSPPRPTTRGTSRWRVRARCWTS